MIQTLSVCLVAVIGDYLPTHLKKVMVLCKCVQIPAKLVNLHVELIQQIQP